MTTWDSFFAGRFIAVGFITMFGAVFLFLLTEKMGWLRPQRAIVAISLLAALYCVAAGVSLHFGWQDPFASADPTHYARASASGRGGGGIILLAIRFWPYVLIGLGGIFGYHALRILRALSAERRRMETERPIASR